MNQNYYQDTYLPGIIKTGKWTSWVGAFFVFVPALAVTFLFGIRPDKEPFMVAIIAQLSVNAVWWFIEPISFFPILGVPGTYMSFLSGNISNLRIPCAAAALKATNTEVGTEKGSIISTIGVGASVFVNIILLVIGVVVGTKVIAMLPKNITDSFSYLLPALFGAVYAQFSVDDVKSGICGISLGVGTLLLYNRGAFDWLPIDPFVANLIIPIFGTMLFARAVYKRKTKREEETQIAE